MLDTATQTFRTFEISTSISDEVDDSKTKMGKTFFFTSTRVIEMLLIIINASSISLHKE